MTATGGIRFGQYVLLRRIARGGMAEVFLAQQRGLEGFDRRVAVKRILPHLADSPDFLKMFLGEAKLAAQLSHPNIVHIYDFGKVAGDYFIAMEYVDGVHTGHVFKHEERLPNTLVARIGADAAAALHYAHELRGANGKPLDLVHRDVSPANIMVSFDGTVRLCDFGIAKAAMLSDQLTNPGQVKGKYAYMSPEQTIAAPLDGRSDVFSLSIVLWELIVGQNIVSRADAVEAMRAIRDGKLVPLARAAPHVPTPLAEAIEWGLETRREHRATAADLTQALEAFIKSSPELATPMQLGAWVRARFVRDGTGELPALSSVDTPQAEPQGTFAAPGTSVASPGTTVGPPTGTQSSLIAASRIAAGGVHTPEVDDGAETIFSGPPAMTVERGGGPTTSGSPLAVTWNGEDRPRGTGESGTTIAASPIAIAGDTPGGTTVAVTSPGDLGAVLNELADSIRTTGPHGVHNTTAPGPHGGAASGSQPPLGPHATTLKEIRVAEGSHPAPEDEPTSRADSKPRRSPNRAPTERGHDRGPVVEGSLRRNDTRDRRHVIRADSGRATPSGYEPTADVRRPRGVPRRIVAVAVLALLALASFLIVVATHTPQHSDTPPADADQDPSHATRSADAAVADAGSVAISVTADAGAITDASAVAMIDADLGIGPADDAATGTTPTTLLEIRTSPTGATLHVGDQTRLSPAQLALPAGHYLVIADLPGYQSERREFDLPYGEHLIQEIVFTRKLSHPAMGKLTARTTPYSEVFLNGKKLGETPFADLELAPGTYTLVFKNPDHPPVTRRVTITAGKTTKISVPL